MTMPDDARVAALQAWAAPRIGPQPRWSAVAADAGGRRYFRVGFENAVEGTSSRIAVDAPPPGENIAAFVQVAELMRSAGLTVPAVHHTDRDAGFMLLGDLGDERYIDILDADNADALFGSAIGALLDWQSASRPGVLPDYDRATFMREMRLFHQWYLPERLDYVPTGAALTAIELAYEALADIVLAQAPVYVHRDYMPRNLMVTHPLPGVIDFQDARYGPAAYDVASLFRDAFISWPTDRINGWVRHYHDGAIGRGLPVAPRWADFERDIAATGAQRHLKILGLFVRLAVRDGKPAYAADLARFVGYLLPVVDRLACLKPLETLLREAAEAEQVST